MCFCRRTGDWADWLADKGRLDADSLAVFAGNQLVLAVPAGTSIKAAEELGLTPGVKAYALIKSVAIVRRTMTYR